MVVAGIFKTLSALTVGSVYILIILGGYVSSIGAGLACPDWPLCEGRFFPRLDPYVLAEYSHRFTALLAAALVFATFLFAARFLRKSRRVLISSSISCLLILAQIVLGMFAVVAKLNPVVVTGHLALGTALFGSVLVNMIFAFETVEPN